MSINNFRAFVNHFYAQFGKIFFILRADRLRRFARDDKFFVRGNHEHLDGRILRGNLADRAVVAAVVFGFVENDPERLHIRKHRRPNGRRILAHPCGKHDAIESAVYAPTYFLQA